MSAVKTLLDQPDASALRFPKSSSVPQTDVARAIEYLKAQLANYQPLDSDLTAIAALATTSFGRSLLTAADAAVGFNMLAPTTTRGDTIYRNATTNTRLPAGTAGYLFQTNGAGADPSWSGYLHPATDAQTRTWNAKASETLSLKDFGAVGDGTSAVTAFNRAIAWMNTAPGTGRTVEIPEGEYLIDSACTAVAASRSCFVGMGDNSRVLISVNGNAFTWGVNSGSAIVGGGFSNCSISYPSTPGASAVVFTLRNANRAEFHTLNLENIAVLGVVGTSASFPCAITWFHNLTGNVYNSGLGTFDLRFGAGFFTDAIQLYVDGVALPVNNNPGTSMSVVAGTRFIQMVAAASWDTIMCSNMIIERYDSGLYLIGATSKVLHNIWVDTCIFDYCANFGLLCYADTSGTVTGLHVINSWLTAFDGVALSFDGPGVNSLHQVSNSRMFLTKFQGVSCSATTSGVVFTGNHVFANNRAGTTYNAFDIAAGASLVTLAANDIGRDTTSFGLAFQGVRGLAIGNCSKIVAVGNQLAGSSSGDSLGTLTDSYYFANQGSLVDYIGDLVMTRSTGRVVTKAVNGTGYASGSGGAVTQGTNRTTAVTLDKACGAITLFSAAGSATPASFTVNNSTVSETDVVHVSQKSGTDKYVVIVTAVTDGTFQITFWTTGGTTTEQPVFNFTVEKAVAA